MRRIKQLLLAFTANMLLAAMVASQFAVANVSAEAASAPSLVISQLKITSSNGQFITLYNATNTTLDMGKYQLEYFNNYDLAKATSSKLISLSGTIPPHGYFMINDSALLLCYQLTVDSVSLGLSSTAGMVEVLAYNQSGAGGSATPVLQDFVGWSKTAASGAQTLPGSTNAFLQRLPVDSANNPQISNPGAGSWQTAQPASDNACNLVNANATAIVQTGLSQLLPAVEPPATIIGQATGSASYDSTDLPADDIGLMAPLITEVLPNPAGTGNDAIDEFIELYNPNTVDFDLSGFKLQAGLSSLHTFAFTADTSLPAQSFTTFYASTTRLSLSNSSGQIKLLDPAGNSVSATATYGTAKDDQAWALANGKWYWTTHPTPGETNVIIQPASAQASAKTSSKSKTSKNSAAKTTKKKAVKAKKPKKIKKTSTSLAKSASVPDQSTPIKSSTLAVLAGLALLYGTYEYRTDLANRYRQLKRNFKPGSGSGP